ncbi:hypothetical protein C7C46_02415 [Streptomyces tateyamensis]|uniref:Uncharacterized protein n=1 Tax=Streptomyces tateyamensis TaxID=565073 RepID=A0A2V4NMW2_9ACTN|nr:hypothetical protein [Streptomyces tateyamensis]PYC87912.1 hypothetical protein C7C46_02415 [Streptomyces tateyamensis]
MLAEVARQGSVSDYLRTGLLTLAIAVLLFWMGQLRRRTGRKPPWVFTPAERTDLLGSAGQQLGPTRVDKAGGGALIGVGCFFVLGTVIMFGEALAGL